MTMTAKRNNPHGLGVGWRKLTCKAWPCSTTRQGVAITRNPDEAINNDIATVRDAFKRYEAETGVDPSTLPREQQREIALGGLNALDQGAAPEGVLESAGFRRWFGDRSIEQLEADYAALTDEDGNNRTDDGHKIDTDLVRELSPDYVADRSRSQEMHFYASALTKVLFKRALDRPVREGKSPVVAFLAGGGGSGKSTAAKEYLADLNPDITFDGTLSKLDSARRDIEASLASQNNGRDVAVVFVYRSPEKSVAGAIHRAIEKGRPVPAWVLAEAHASSPKVVKVLAKEYDANDRVEVVAIWNDGELDERHEIPVQEVPDVNQDEAERTFRAAIEAEREAGRLNEKLHAAFTVPRPMEGEGVGATQPPNSGNATGHTLTQDPAAGGVSDSGAALNQSGDDGFSEEGRKQARDVERAYGGRQGYERDKAAGRTKLTYGQWVQVRMPNFLRWFGDWLALRAQQRLDAMEPVKVRVPEDWRGLSHVELRQKMAEALDRMVRDRTGIEHPELGTIRVGRTGASKSVNTARDPAKSLVAADIEALIPAPIYARSEPSRGGDGKDIDGYSTLLARIEVDGIPLIAAFTVRHQSDGQWYYNAVTLHDGNKKARDSYGQPDQDGSSHAPIAGLAEFVRRQLIRVNPAEVSRVIDPETGEPLVVYHGTRESFDTFDKAKSIVGSGVFYFAPNHDGVNGYAGGGSVMPVFLSLKTPYEADGYSKYDFNFVDGKFAIGTLSKGDVKALEARGYDGARLNRQDRPAEIAAFRPNQIKSATANNGDFSADNPNILKQADGNKKSPRGQIVGRDGQSIIGQKAVDGSREFNITLFDGKDLSTVLRARRRQGEATRWHWTVQVQHEA